MKRKLNGDYNFTEAKNNFTNEDDINKLKPKLMSRPLSNPELSSLKETENLFHSSFFRLQIEELIKEVKFRKTKSVDDWLKIFFEILHKTSENFEPHDITDQQWINEHDVEVPIVQNPFFTEGTFQYIKPVQSYIIGSYFHGYATNNLVIDIAVEMPKGCFENLDYVNHRYLRKRAIYLACLTILLKNKSCIKNIKYSYLHGDHLKPVLLIKPSGKWLNKFSVRVLVIPPSNTFKWKKLQPSKCNVFLDWYFQNDNKDIPEFSTPNYNSSIMVDLNVKHNYHFVSEVIGTHSSVLDALILLKVWLCQRHLDQGYGSFNVFIMMMYICYLLKTKKINSMMSSYQIIRTVWLHLGQSDWTVAGITLADPKINKQPSLEEFQKNFEVVFVDSTGFLNLCYAMTATTFMRVKHECHLSIQILDASLQTVDNFSELFITAVPFTLKFDNLIHIKCEDTWIKNVIKCLGLENKLVNLGGLHLPLVKKHIINVLNEGYGERISMLDIMLNLPKEWDVNEYPSNPDENILTLGILLNPDFCNSIIIKGSSDNSDSVKFQEFWGNISELRRFQDGSICEAVLLPGKSMEERRQACNYIAVHLLKRHLKIQDENILYIGNQINCLLHLPCISNSTETFDDGHERQIAILQQFDGLSKILRNLNSLPLSLTSVQGASPALRYCEVFPPLPNPNLQFDLEKRNQIEITKLKQFSPSLNVILQLESSSKWPDDIIAIKHLKAAFYSKLGRELKFKNKIICSVTPEAIDIVMNGLIFKIIIATNHEIIALQKVHTPDSATKMTETPDSLNLKKETEILPKISSALYGLQMSHGVYSSACRLCKRWIAAHLLGDHISEMCIELLVAYCFISSVPFTVPNCSQTAFLRFLSLLSKYDWKNLPLIVNLNQEFKKEDVAVINSKFSSERSSLPAMFIATPYDKFSSLWTQKTPTLQVLHRLTVLAEKSLSTLNQQLSNFGTFDYKIAFRPPLEIYDVVIHLDESQVPNIEQAVDYSHSERKTLEFIRTQIPVVGYNSIQCFFQELKDAFSDIAMFFYDPFGGSHIFVLWKPSIFDPKIFKVFNINCHKSSNTENSCEIKLNLEAVLEDFLVLGKGLIKHIQVKST